MNKNNGLTIERRKTVTQHRTTKNTDRKRERREILSNELQFLNEL
jgi:hypothetical protein